MFNHCCIFNFNTAVQHEDFVKPNIHEDIVEHLGNASSGFLNGNDVKYCDLNILPPLPGGQMTQPDANVNNFINSGWFLDSHSTRLSHNFDYYNVLGSESTTLPCESILDSQFYISQGMGHVGSLHNTFGYFNHSPLVVSANVPNSSISANILDYVDFNKKFSGAPNFIAKLAPVASHINVQKFRELGQGFHDQQIFDLIQYGFPLDLDKPNFIPNSAVTNHGSALQFPAAVEKYLSEEINLGSILGPFEDPPFPGSSLQSTFDCSKRGG
jgi:hypothetical protein